MNDITSSFLNQRKKINLREIFDHIRISPQMFLSHVPVTFNADAIILIIHRFHATFIQ